MSAVEPEPSPCFQEADFEEGHERYRRQEDMLAHYRDYYGNKVDFNSVIKIVKYKISEVYE